MSLTPPFKIGLNTASTAIVLIDSNNIMRFIQRPSFLPTEVDGTNVSITFNYLYDSKPVTLTAPYTEYFDLSNNPIGISANAVALALSNLMGFNIGGGGGSVNSVTASSPLQSSGGANPNLFFAAQPDGNYGLNFLGGVPTLVPIQGETVGSYKAFSTTVIPSNYLWCNGATVLIATYPDLFSVIGNTYGGDGITTFAVPNITDRLPKGDNGTNIGTSGGANTLSNSQLPIVNASGSLQVSTNDGDILATNGAYPANPSDGGTVFNGFIANGLQNPTVNIAGVNVNFGSGQPHEHPYLSVRWAICFESVGISGASPTPSFDQTLAVNNDSSIRALFNGIPYALSQVLTANESIITTTTPYVATDNIQTIYINPPANLATSDITLPPSPTNGQKVVIACGGDITSGSVVTALTVQGTVGKDVLSGDISNPTTLVTNAFVGTFTFQYSSQLSKWIVL